MGCGNRILWWIGTIGFHVSLGHHNSHNKQWREYASVNQKSGRVTFCVPFMSLQTLLPDSIGDWQSYQVGIKIRPFTYHPALDWVSRRMIMAKICNFVILLGLAVLLPATISEFPTECSDGSGGICVLKGTCHVPPVPGAPVPCPEGFDCCFGRKNGDLKSRTYESLIARIIILFFSSNKRHKGHKLQREGRWVFQVL